MKNIYIIWLVASLAALTGCKKNDWLDWRSQNVVWMEQNKTRSYTDENGKTYPVKTTHSGLQYVILGDPNPTEARPGSTSNVTCRYTLDLVNTIDNKSYHLEESKGATFAMSSVVRGFSEGLKLIHNHGHILLYIPYDLGYGSEGSGTDGGSAFVPPFSTLIFDVTINDIY